MFRGSKFLNLELFIDHKSSSSDDLTLQQMEKRENVYRKSVCKFCKGLACEQALHLGEKQTSERHATGDAKAGVLLARAFSRGWLRSLKQESSLPGWYRVILCHAVKGVVSRLSCSFWYSTECTRTQLRNHVTCPYSPRDFLKLANKMLKKDKIALASC